MDDGCVDDWYYIDLEQNICVCVCVCGCLIQVIYLCIKERKGTELIWS